MVIQSIKGILGTRTFASVPVFATLEETYDLITAEGVSAAVVLQDGDLRGIVTEKDVIRHASQRGGFDTTTVDQVMTQEVVSIQTNGSVAEAFTHMQMGGFQQLPVLDMGMKVVGILTFEDIPAENWSTCGAEARVAAA